VRRGLLDPTTVLPTRALTRADWLGAIAVFLLVFASTFPIVIPFLVFQQLHTALRASNAVALVMMFAAGYWLARHSGHHPWRMGVSVTLLGVVLVGIAIALGG
jgi:VIT1/CCC1 family predicted Fe2+/Mn2+ transporter